MGYHHNKIERGVFGCASKIREEFEEFQDAINQNNPIMALLELSDLLGAMEAWAAHHNISLVDIINMKCATEKAFEDGTRKSKE